MAYSSTQKPPAFPLPTDGLATAQKIKPRMAQRGEAATECREAHGVVELAPALGRGGWPESASKLSKLDALQALRDVRQASGTTGPDSS